MNAVVIIGRLRSGGAAVASLLVPMGYSPGVTLSAPCPPTWRVEWDDVRLTKALLDTKREDRQEVYAALKACAERADSLNADALFKNAYLALWWGSAKFDIEELCGATPFIIRTVRSEQARQRSLDATFHTIPGGRELDARVTAACEEIAPDYTVSYEALQDDMEGELEKLCLAMEGATCLG